GGWGVGVVGVGGGGGGGLFQIFERQAELLGIELFRASPELHPLQLTDQVAQSVVLPGQLIALLDEPRLLGPLGVALGPRRQHQRAQRGDVVRQDLSGRVTLGLSHCAATPVSAQPTAESKRRRPSDQGGPEAQPASCGRLIRGAYTRRQSSPSNSAASGAVDSRISPSLIAGHLKLDPSSRFQTNTR